jgi:hypothetical protein
MFLKKKPYLWTHSIIILKKTLLYLLFILGVSIINHQKFKKVVNYMDQIKDLANVERFNGEGFIMWK